MSNAVNIFWFRRDLRLEDNVGFSKALRGTYPVLPIFIFDSEILAELPMDDARLSFIHDHVLKIQKQLEDHKSGVAMYHGSPVEVFQQIFEAFDVKNIITNHDYEPYAQTRDTAIKEFTSKLDVGFYTYKDQVIFERDDIVKGDGTPYVVYTPFKNKWKLAFDAVRDLIEHSTEDHWNNLLKDIQLPQLSLSQLGFEQSEILVADFDIGPGTIQNYEATRNFPDQDGTSRIGPHLRFGTVSIRQVVKKAIAENNEIFWNELIWREFFMQIMWHFPHTVDKAFRPKYDRIKWRNKTEEFEAWKKGETGYLLVDAGMRELNQTGHMHNRVRMLVASFLCKHLLIDWRWGEAYFAEKLLDYELSSNVGNWQWAAGSGVDAAPYFRIFNPMTQVEKFDKNKNYIKQWVPEFETEHYVAKMVDHKKARERCLKVYKEAVA